MQGRADAQSNYQHMLASYRDLLRESAQYYSDYLDRTVNLTLPDCATAAGVRLVTHQRDPGTCHQPVPGHWTRRGISNFRHEPASGLCVVLWARFVLDFVCSEFGGRFRNHAARRSSLSASFSGKMARFHMKFLRAQALSRGSRIFPMATLPLTPRRSTSLRRTITWCAAGTSSLRGRNGTACGRLTSSCGPPTTRRISRRTSALVTGGWKAGRCCP